MASGYKVLFLAVYGKKPPSVKLSRVQAYLTNGRDRSRVSQYFLQKRMVMGWLLKPSSLIKSGNLCVPFATHQSNHNLMRNREWIESSSCGMAVLRGNDILMTTHIYVIKVVISTFCYENTA